MYYDGSIEDAIAVSVRDQKFFVIVIIPEPGVETDGADLGVWTRMEEQLLRNQEFLDRQRQLAVMVKVSSESKDAEFLRQLIDVTVVPSVFSVKQGQVVGRLENLPCSTSEWARKLFVEKQETRSLVAATTPKSIRSESSSSRKTYEAEMRAKRVSEIKDRQRILDMIDSDKKDRRTHRQTNSVERSSAEIMGTLQTRTKSGDCALNIRLFGGSLLKKRFPSLSTLGSIRQQIDDSHVTRQDAPYSLSQTFPTRVFSASDEEKSLEELGLCPSATLVLKPVQNYSDAYQTVSSSWIEGGMNYVSNIGSSLWNMISTGVKPSPLATTHGETPRTDKTDAEWYNGNSLAQEPNPDDRG